MARIVGLSRFLGYEVSGFGQAVSHQFLDEQAQQLRSATDVGLAINGIALCFDRTLLCFSQLGHVGNRKPLDCEQCDVPFRGSQRPVIKMFFKKFCECSRRHHQLVLHPFLPNKSVAQLESRESHADEKNRRDDVFKSISKTIFIMFLTPEHVDQTVVQKEQGAEELQNEQNPKGQLGVEL